MLLLGKLTQDTEIVVDGSIFVTSLKTFKIKNKKFKHTPTLVVKKRIYEITYWSSKAI